jgi:hypothetical protein
MKGIHYLVYFLIFITIHGKCGGGEDTKKREQQVQLLVYLQNNKTPNSSTQAACFNFLPLPRAPVSLSQIVKAPSALTQN